MKRAGLLIALALGACDSGGAPGDGDTGESSDGGSSSESSSSTSSSDSTSGGGDSSGAVDSSGGVGGSESTGVSEDPGTKDIWEPCNGADVTCDDDLTCVRSYNSNTSTWYGYCAPHCQIDSDCPVPPGWSSICDYQDNAICIIPCDAQLEPVGQCPNGWTCHHSDGLAFDLCMPEEA